MDIKKTISSMIGITNEDILNMMLINKAKIQKIDTLIKEFNLNNITEQDLNRFKEHLIWCHKEILKLYDEYDRIIKATEETERKIRLYR